MSMRYITFNKNVNVRSVWNVIMLKYNILQHIKYTKCINPKRIKFNNKTYQSKLLVNNVTKNNERGQSWKWLLAISSVYAGYNNQDIFELIDNGKVLDLVRYLKDNPKEVNNRHKYGWAPLHVAAVKDKYRHLETLLKCGADPDIGDGFSNVFNVSRKFNEHSTKVSAARQDDFPSFFNPKATVQGFTALHYAALLNNVESLRVLMKYGADPFLKSVTGHTPINLTTDVEVYRMLQEYEINFENIRKQRETEERKNFPLELRLKQKIVGQESAIKSVAAAIRRKENGWMDEEHPLVFLFLGSSGIGKTELAKQIANYLHKNNKDGFIRLDMSEYQEKHEVSKMIGSPPGYIGHDEGGLLVKQLRKNPNAVVLFDEVDKAHRDVLTILLQLFDEGRLTDGKGKTIECKSAIFVMTSNLASNTIAEHALELRKEQRENDRLYNNIVENKNDREMFISRKFKDEIVKPILKRHFQRDEFLGRINEIVYFLPFSEMELKVIVQRELIQWQERAMKKHKVKIEWETAVEHVLMSSYDISYGARSIKHEVERSVVSLLALAHEKGVIKENAVVKLAADLTKGDNGMIYLLVLHKNKFVPLDEVMKN
ncbi:caseinolytic peptidase B protein homolog [Adelges cooleyi]|uniref:caseinolytic peptidase B protein homolog n=1 Tax=Adelges cooleyi TaxID=133065 RepID=UPI00217F3398|nr:caseinolytic peptidase B protein homolog [Adelges cooleyi]